MSRSRNIKPGFFKNEDLAELPFWMRLLYIGLWCEADREGRFEDRPVKLKMAIFPGDAIDVADGIVALQKSGFIFLYESNGKSYGQIIEWKKHQNPHHKEKMSVIPSPESLGLDMRSTRAMPQASIPMHEGKVSGFSSDASQQEREPEQSIEAKPEASPPMEGGVNRADSLIPDSGFLIPDSLQDQDLLSSGAIVKSRFDDFWAVYPLKKGKAAAEKKWKARRLDAIADRIIDDVRLRMANDRQWLDGYVPHGSTYVNGKGWEDAIESNVRRINSSAPPSKTLTAIQSLEDMKNGSVDRTRDCGRISEADDLESRQAARGRLDQRYRDDMV